MKKNILILLLSIHLVSYSQTLQDSLFAFYPFTGNAIDSSGKGNNGTVNGATLTTDRFGRSNSAYLFDGTNDEIRISNAFKGKQPFTTNASVCYWMKTNTTKTAAAILAFHSACSNNTNDLMTFYINNDAGSHYLYNTVYWHSPVLSVEQNTVTDNVWHFVCYTYDKDSATLYVDGTKVLKSFVTPESGFTFDKNTALVIGNISSNSCGYDFYFQGSIDDIRLYNRTLSQKDVSNLKNNKLDIQTSVLSNKPNLYPNPSLNVINISNLGSEITSFELTDITGKIFFSHKNDLTLIQTIDLSNYSNGLYNIVFKNNNDQIVYSEKIVISK